MTTWSVSIDLSTFLFKVQTCMPIFPHMPPRCLSVALRAAWPFPNGRRCKINDRRSGDHVQGHVSKMTVTAKRSELWKTPQFPTTSITLRTQASVGHKHRVSPEPLLQLSWHFTTTFKVNLAQGAAPEELNTWKCSVNGSCAGDDSVAYLFSGVPTRMYQQMLSQTCMY